MRKSLIAATAGLAFAITSPSFAAAITFAEYSPQTGANNIQYTPTLPTGGTVQSYSTGGGAGSAASVQFRFLNNPAATSGFLNLVGLGNINALFTMSSTSITALTNPVPALPAFTVGTGFSGTQEYRTVSAININNRSFAAGSLLLGVDYTDGYVTRTSDQGNAGAGTGDNSDITYDFTNVNYRSDFVGFGNQGSPSERAVSMSWTGVNDVSGQPGAFRGTSSGNFASNPFPLIPAVPEPATWAMMVVGFGAVGSAMRSARRRKALVAA